MKFLDRVWGRDGQVYLSSNDYERDGSWVDEAFILPASEAVSRRIESLSNTLDVYFSPVKFDGPRREANAKTSEWAWSDLDDVDPREIVPKPTIAWESSPNRFQALWYLGEAVPASEASYLSKRIAFSLGADASGWDITQVLRVPDTTNYKYSSQPTVKLLWDDGPVWTSEGIEKHTQEVSREAAAGSVADMGLSATALLAEYQISPRGLSLLQSSPKEVRGSDRSLRLFELMCHLAESGMSISEIGTVARSSPWNKFKNRPDEWDVLINESRKARNKVQPSPVEIEDLKVTWLPDLLAVADLGAGWLIEDWWLSDSWGFVGGEAKSFKSLMTMETTISVASGLPLFGKLQVDRQGPVLIVQEENDTLTLQNMLFGILQSRGLFTGPPIESKDGIWTLAGMKPLPIAFLNQTGMNMTDLNRREHVEKVISQIEPALVVFDPLYDMIPGVDPNRTEEMQPVLNWLRNLSPKYRTSIMIVDHQRKKQGKNDSSRAGQRLSGHHIKHNWFMCGLFIDRASDKDNTIFIDRQFRRSGGHGLMKVEPKFNPEYELVIQTS